MLFIYLTCELQRNNPDASKDVSHDEENEAEEDQTLEPEADLQYLVEVGQEFGPLFHYFEDSEHLGHSNQLVHPSEPDEPCEIVVAALVVNEKFKRDDRHQVDQKPAEDIGPRDLLPAFDDSKLKIIDGRVENKHDIDEEKGIDDGVDDFPLQRVLDFSKRNSIGRNDARHQKDDGDKQIPVFFVLVLRVNQAPLLLLPQPHSLLP